MRAKPIIQAHRGASAYAPENTMEAFRMARDMRADGIELDVHLTRDGKLAVIHDADISRTSDGEGAVCDMSLSELRQYSYAAGFAEQYSGTKVNLPTLEEVYDLVRGTGMLVNVELKGGGEKMIRLAAECEKACGMEGLVIYSSFRHEWLDLMRAFCPEAYTAPLYVTGIDAPWEYARTHRASALHPRYETVYEYPDYIGRCHENGIQVNVWTVDSPEEMKRLDALGVDSLITNRPDVAFRALKKHG